MSFITIELCRYNYNNNYARFSEKQKSQYFLKCYIKRILHK